KLQRSRSRRNLPPGHESDAQVAAARFGESLPRPQGFEIRCQRLSFEQRLYGKLLLVRQAFPQRDDPAFPFRQRSRKARVSEFALEKGVFPRSDTRHTA